MSPQVAIQETGADPAAVIAALKNAGFIIVGKDAIRQAQKDAYYEALEDVRMELKRAS